MEDGRITVIASTTENPYFYVYNAVLSRSTVFEFKQVPAAEVEKGRAARGVHSQRAGKCHGGHRARYGGVYRVRLRRRCAQGAQCGRAALFGGAAGRNTIRLLRTDAENITQRSAMHYDRAGDDHYDVVSALMKSLRGSDRTQRCTIWHACSRLAT